MSPKIKQIQCRSAIGKCGFPDGGWAINPYVGCGHRCAYCYARFMRRFTGHQGRWGSFVDVRANIADVLSRQIKNPKYRHQQIYIGTVTDPYQPLEEKYRLTRKILSALQPYDLEIDILTKSDLVLRDLDLLKKCKNISVSFTINTLDESWRRLVEPGSVSIERRLAAAKTLVKNRIPAMAMMGPCWPHFTAAEPLFKKFKQAGVSHVFSESFNTYGGNWVGVEQILRRHYPKLLPVFKKTFFDREAFTAFYDEAERELKRLSRIYRIPVTIYFGQGHASKFDSKSNKQ